MAYGFGARTVPGEGPGSDMIAMTGNYMNPFLDSKDPESLHKCYAHTLRNVRLALPVNYRAIIKMVCDLAQIEYGTVSETR
jgi:hypothetical protein